MTISQQFATNIVETDFSTLDDTAIERARWRILDAIGCLVAGANAAGCRAMLSMVKKWGGATESTILVHGIKSPAFHAAMVNSLMTRSFDFEPVDAEGENRSSPAHISGTTVPTALAMGEYKAIGGKELITALVLGDDISSRLGVASGFDFELGWDNTGTINEFGATAIAGKLLGLNAKQMHNAFGIVLNQVAGTMDGVYDKSMSFKLPIALSARNGIFSAELAGQGFIGVKDPFLGDHGFFRLYCRNYDTREITKDLGKRFYADAVIKPYSACRMTHSSIDSALKIANDSYYKVEDITEIEVLLTPGVFKGFCSQLSFHGDTPQVEAAFSIPYTVACALLRRDVKPDYFTEVAIHDQEIENLIGKMRLMPDIPDDEGQRTQINIKMRDGRKLSATTDFPKGHYVKSPITANEIKEKFISNVAFSQTIPVDKAEKALSIIEKLEELKDVRELVGLLVE